MKNGTTARILKFLGIFLLLTGIALGLARCGTAECGGTETGNPTTCTQNAPTTGGDDTAVEGDDSTDSSDDDADADDAGDGVSSPDSDNDLNATPSLSNPFIETLAWGDDADLGFEETVLIFNAEDDLAAFWEEFFGDREDLPEVDFSTHIVAAAILGERGNGGYSLAFTDQHVEDGTLVLTLTETTPGTACMNTQAFVNPYHVVSVPTAGEDIAVETQSVVADCE